MYKTRDFPRFHGAGKTWCTADAKVNEDQIFREELNIFTRNKL